MGKNGYFQLIQEGPKLLLKVFPPEADGILFKTEELFDYLDRKKIDYELVEVDKYIKANAFDEPLALGDITIIPEAEDMLLEIRDNGLSAVARFYPPSTGGAVIKKEEIIRTVEAKGIKHGFHEEVVERFMVEREYCTDYEIATATLPVHGKDAEIIYHFDTNFSVRPKLNEDGSVDFHQLGNIKPVREGEKLATLIPEDKGTPGTSVLGKVLTAKKVSRKILRYGKNIRINEEKTEIFSEVAGHVSLIEGMVYVSDTYAVPQNVDSSTGDIEYSGTVQIPGNVLTGFSVKADGDIIVFGAVEGAVLKAGGNIILKNGMQGMGRGSIKAGGNIFAKFFENCKIECEGKIMCDAMMHTDCTCTGDIEVRGKRGLITGGHVVSYGKIIAKTIGSNMGSDTKLEICVNKEAITRRNQIEKDKAEIVPQIQKMDALFRAYGEKLRNGEKFAPEQENAIRLTMAQRAKLVEQLQQMDIEYEALEDKIKENVDMTIVATGDVFPGVKLVIKDMMKIMKERSSRCKFYLDGADVRITGI